MRAGVQEATSAELWRARRLATLPPHAQLAQLALEGLHVAIVKTLQHVLVVISFLSLCARTHYGDRVGVSAASFGYKRWPGQVQTPQRPALPHSRTTCRRRHWHRGCLRPCYARYGQQLHAIACCKCAACMHSSSCPLVCMAAQLTGSGAMHGGAMSCSAI